MSTLDDKLRETISLYSSYNDIDSVSLFTLNREIALARYALNEQAFAYEKAITVLSTLLEQSICNLSSQPAVLTNILSVIQAIENKSSHLIDAVNKVANLVGNAALIDIDKAMLKTTLLSLPEAVRDTIVSLTSDENLADRVSISLSGKVNQLMLSIKGNNSEADVSFNTNAVTFDDLQNMVNSVPTSGYIN